MNQRNPNIRSGVIPNQLVKIKVRLPPDDPSGGEAEWLWAEYDDRNLLILRNVPVFAFGLSYGDTVNSSIVDGVPVFTDVAERGGHSTYRIYARTDRRSPEIRTVIKRLEAMNCDIELATNRIVAVDVLPPADIHAVFAVLKKAEQEGILDFEEGHCGHAI